jgi:hypothetical protein
VGSLQDLEARKSADIHAPAPVATPQALRPQWKGDEAYHAAGGKDYAPAEPHGWAKFGHVMAGLIEPTNRVFNEMPERRAEQAYKNATAEYEAPIAEAKTEAETEQKTSRAEKDRADAERARNPQGDWKNVPGLVGPNNEPIELNEKTGEHRYAQGLQGAKPIKAPGETQEQNKLGFQGVVGKLDTAGLSTDPKTLDKSLDAALKRGVITPAEHATARSYEAANQTPGTNLTVHVAGQEEGNRLAIDKMFEGGEVLAHMPDGRRVQMSYADAKSQNIPAERLVKLNAKEAQDTRDKAASVQTTFKGLDSYRSDFKSSAPNLTPQDRDALRVLASHNQSGQTGSILAGFIDDLPLAGPLSSYANKLLDGTMTSDQYKQLSPAGKKLVSDYFTAIIDNFANMKNIMGSVGRNPMMLQAEVNTIPVPYLDWESANLQFENKRSSLQGRARSLPELYTAGAK